MIYTGMLGLGLAGFGFSTNNHIMKNVTTNEHLRKKWNATQSQNDQQTSHWDKIKQYYFKPLPKSRLQHYCEIRDAIFDQNDSERSSSEISLIDNNSLLLEYGIDLQM